MENNLATSANHADYVVDLSNIVREQSIGGPGLRSLRRLELVVQALVKRTGDPDVRLYLIADASLLGGHRKFTDPVDVDRLRRWVDEGLVEEVPDADERILEIAGMTRIPVITSDRYDAHRTEHYWIQGNTSQFLRPVPAPGGTVRLVPTDMGVRPPAEISRREELAALKKQGLLSLDRTPLINVLTRAWRCPEPRCSLYDIHSGGRVLPPRMRRGVPTCQQHEVPLLDDGPRPGAAQLKAVINGTCEARYTLDEDSETTVGRHPDSETAGIPLYSLLDSEAAGRVSREHVVVSIRKGTVLVRDISSYGTRMRNVDRQGLPGDWERLLPQVDRRFHPGDEVELAPGVILTRSGRLFPAELPDAWRSVAPQTPVPPGAAAPTMSA
ncbi:MULTISPECIES: FHA domain-containing protein [unclassified Frankia]|uniref:FHA domain-containing protein n=1 Tax=unclassified Frankia TaxID=2632575 RepID=UPI001EF633EB|nr:MULTISPECIES: FHA domain-containing protein [unclassified Frankia]